MLWVRELFINNMLSLEPPHSHVWNNPLKGHKKTRSEGPSEQNICKLYFLILNIGLSLQSTAVLNLFYPIFKSNGFFFFHSPNIHTIFFVSKYICFRSNKSDAFPVYFLYSFNFSPHKVKFSRREITVEYEEVYQNQFDLLHIHEIFPIINIPNFPFLKIKLLTYSYFYGIFWNLKHHHETLYS